MLLYATQFISLSSTNYQAVWWKLFHSTDASDWMNALKLARLLFSLPVSNGKLERVFSTMKNIKQEKRSSMSNELFDDLLVINVEKVNVEDFNPDDSIELWWKAKTRCPNQKKRKEYRRKCSLSPQQQLPVVVWTMIQVTLVWLICWKTGMVGWMTIPNFIMCCISSSHVT